MIVGAAPVIDLPCLKAVAALGRGAKGAVFLVEAEAWEERLALKAISRKLVERKSKDNGKDSGGGDDDRESGYRRICFELPVGRHEGVGIPPDLSQKM